MHARLELDLLEDWVVVIAQGSLFSRHGRLRTVAVASHEAGERYLADLHKRRLRRGYRLIG